MRRPATDRPFLYRVIFPILFHGGPPGKEARRLIATRFDELNATNVTAATWAATIQHSCVNAFEGKARSRPTRWPSRRETQPALLRVGGMISIYRVLEIRVDYGPVFGLRMCTGTLPSQIESPAAPLRRAQG